MSFLSSIKEWLLGSSGEPQEHQTIASIPPCRHRLDNGTSSTFTLPDGRKIGYAQYGLPTGKPILYQHGFPGSRLEASQHHDLCLELGLRIIAIDRPGHGWSSPHPSSQLLDWPNDLEQLAEHLELESYSVMGVSGGGPSALACAYAMSPQKLKCVAIVCGIGPPDIGMNGADLPHRIGWPYGIAYAPYWVGRLFWRSSWIGRLDLTDEQRLELLMKEGKGALECDRDVYNDLDYLQLCVKSTREAFAQGYDHVWDDGALGCKDFGFKLEDIREDLPVKLWYGRKDTFVPLIQGSQIAARIGSRAHLRVEDETHTGILMHWRREIFEALQRNM